MSLQVSLTQSSHIRVAKCCPGLSLHLRCQLLPVDENLLARTDPANIAGMTTPLLGIPEDEIHAWRMTGRGDDLEQCALTASDIKHFELGWPGRRLDQDRLKFKTYKEALKFKTLAEQIFEAGMAQAVNDVRKVLRIK